MPKKKVDNQWLILWYSNLNWSKKEAYLPEKDRFNHFYMIWQTWTGKSTMILKQAISDIQKGHWVCVFDIYWDLSEKILQYYPKKRVDDLIYFDLWNTKYPIAFNPLDWAQTDDEKDLLVNNLVDVFVDLYWPELFWPRIQDYFRNACLLLMESRNGWTFMEVIRLISDKIFLESKTRNIKDPMVDYRRNKVYNQMWDREKQEILPFIQAKFSPFTTSRYLRYVIWQPNAQPKTWFNFENFMQEKKVIICKFPKQVIWETNSNIMFRLILMKLRQAILKRVDIPKEERAPFFVYLDDFYQYAPKNFWELLHEATKYNVWITMSNQYLDQLKQWDKDISRTILNNVWTILSFRVGDLDANCLENYFSPEFSKNDLKSLETFKWIIKTSSNWIQWKPFIIDTDIELDKTLLNKKDKIDILKEISVLRWWTKKELVDKEIRFRIWV